MSMFRRTIGLAILWTVAMVAWNGGSRELAAAEDAAANDQFAVPTGDAVVLLRFIDRLANPETRFENRQQAEAYLDNASQAMSVAADRILAGQASDRQAADALQWKVEALRIREMLGDDDAVALRDAFFDRMLKDPRREVAGMVAPMRLAPNLDPRVWRSLKSTGQAQAVDQFVADVKAAGPTLNQARLLIDFSDMLANRPENGLALRAIKALLPEFTAGLADNKKPADQRTLVLLAGMERRLELPGHKIELSGTLMDGTKLDWASYRGKVVLVDFWASWCGECRRELPNMQANYAAYHDKGFEVLGICIDENRHDAEAYIEATDITWPNVYDERGKGSMADKYAILGIPQAILVDQDGKVVTMLARGPYLGVHLQQLLGDPAVDETSATAPADERQTAAEAAPAVR